MVFVPLLAAAALAQQPITLKGRVEPYLASLSRDYPVVGLAVRARRPADSSARVAYAREVYLAGGATLKGGIRAQAHFRAPALARHYRLAASVAVAHKARFFFPGLGNDTEFDRAIETEPRPDYYSVRRNRVALRVDATRWIGSGLGASASVGFERAGFTALAGETVFRNRYGGSLGETDATAGLTVLWDRRDSETIASRGFLLQAGAQIGTGAGNYHRAFGVAEGFLPLGRKTVVVARGAATALGGDPPLLARFELPAWERAIAVFGGDDSHRGLPGSRFIGTAAVFANAEIRQDVAVVRGQWLSIIGLIDSGRVFEGERLRLTIDGLKVSGGIGLALRGARERLGAAIAVVGPEGLRVSLVSGWPF